MVMVNIITYDTPDGPISMNAMELETDAGRKAAEKLGIVINNDAIGIGKDVMRILTDIDSDRRREEDVTALLEAVHDEKKKDPDENGGGGYFVAV